MRSIDIRSAGIMLTNANKRVMDAIEQEMGWDEVAARAIQLAEVQGERDAWETFARLIENTKTKRNPERLSAQEVIGMTAIGPKTDTYSGRNNDAMRAYNDGFRAVAMHLFRKHVREA